MGEPRNGPVQQALEAISGTLSVPQVFVNGEFMGDNSAIQVTRGARKKRMEREMTADVTEESGGVRVW